MIQFLFGIHNHQPVGNFGHVFKKAYQECYRPLLEIFEKHPKIKFSLHHTGCLWDWIIDHAPDYLQLVKHLVNRGQVELLGGAYYEAILPIIPAHDIAGQIELMQQFLDEHFSVRANGIWLAERVWDSSIIIPLARAHINYTILDDTHFYYSGMEPEQMFGYYTTEDNGSPLNIFPIHKNVRYLIPFKPVEECMAWFDLLAKTNPSAAVTMADDGEKFGLWPGTYDWVFKQGYLEKLLTEFEKREEFIQFGHYSSYIQNNKTNGVVYIPNASYEEMGEWALPIKTQKKYISLQHSLKQRPDYETIRPFIRGGIWKNFLTKYPESNRMHKRMMHISRAVSELPMKHIAKEQAQRELFKSQCNCPYWHGLFGGLYLNYLRHANYTAMLNAEKILHDIHKATAELVENDYDKDGSNEFFIHNHHLNLIIKPNYGGTISEIDFLPSSFNIANVLTRRKEVYHDNIHSAESQSHNDGELVNIHDLQHVKETGLSNLLFYDWYEKVNFLDHFFGENTTFESVYRNQYAELGNFITSQYQVEKIVKNQHSIGVKLACDGQLSTPIKIYPIHLKKSYLLAKKDDNNLTVEYQIENMSNEHLMMHFGSELNLTLLAGDAPDRYYRWKHIETEKAALRTKLDLEHLTQIEMLDEWSQIHITISWQDTARVWLFPIETISQSESGVEKTYQGSSIIPNWIFKLGPQEIKTLSLKLSVQKI